jgi:hypothetical protein
LVRKANPAIRNKQIHHHQPDPFFHLLFAEKNAQTENIIYDQLACAMESCEIDFSNPAAFQKPLVDCTPAVRAHQAAVFSPPDYETLNKLPNCLAF